jgi:3',5'-cyclic AMP phosphodiesterase CpdA
MRILLTADLHYNHAKSRPLAQDLIAEINSTGGDVLVVIGDTAVADGDWLEQCLSRFQFAGPKLFVAGNHELWTHGPDSYSLFTEELPRRVRNLGWRWLETEPFITPDLAIVGSIGWYDYSFAEPSLEIPQRFYAAKVSPGAAAILPTFAELFEPADDISPTARNIIARWNDGKFIKLGRNDEQFLQEILDRLSSQLTALATTPQVIAAVHNVPFRQLLPPSHSAQWDFAKAYLGSQRLGQLLTSHPNISHVFCGHSHLAMQTTVDHIAAVNVGSGYRWKTFHTLDVG